MTLWLRQRRWWGLCLGVLVTSALVAAVGSVQVPLPAFFSAGSGAVVLATFAPLALVAAVADAFAGACQSVEARAAQRVRLFDTGLFVTVTAVSVALLGLVGVAGWAHAFGSVMVLCGLTTALALRGGAGAGVLAATLLLLFTTFYGSAAPGARFVHVLQPDGDAACSVLCGLVCCGVAVGILLANGVTMRLGSGVGTE